MPESTREAPRELSDERIDAFVRDGFVAIRGAVDPDFCEAHVRLGLQRLGAREDDPETWSPRRIHMPVSQGFPLREHAPRAWEALCQLLGGAERVREPAVFCDNFTVVWPGEGPPWRPPEEERGGWHVDGDWFLHFLDSPEQAILGIVLWRDIEPGQGGTYFAPDSIGPVARFLVAHPEGLEPEGFDFDALRGECRDLREITGRAGDFFWMHPFMLHSASINGRDRPRILSQ